MTLGTRSRQQDVGYVMFLSDESLDYWITCRLSRMLSVSLGRSTRMRNALRATCGYNLVGSFIIPCATYDFAVDPCARETCVSVRSTKDHNRFGLSRFVDQDSLVVSIPCVICFYNAPHKKMCVSIRSLYDLIILISLHWIALFLQVSYLYESYHNFIISCFTQFYVRQLSFLKIIFIELDFFRLIHICMFE